MEVKSMENRGKLTGIGVGPGDPELLTIKAVKAILRSDVVVAPGLPCEKSTAYRIACKALPELKDREVIGVRVPMTRDRNILDAAYRKTADLIEGWLREGKQVGFLTMGDVTVYSAYMYVHKLVAADGFRTEIVNGVPSFCAAAARLNTNLAERSEELHIIPASYQIEKSLELPGTKVFMKAGSQMGKIKKLLKERDLDVVVVENCGMENERIYGTIDEVDENTGYYSLAILKDQQKRDQGWQAG